MIKVIARVGLKSLDVSPCNELLLSPMIIKNSSSHISRHLEFITEQGHRVNWVSGSLDSRVTGSLGHKMWAPPSPTGGARGSDPDRICGRARSPFRVLPRWIGLAAQEAACSWRISASAWLFSLFVRFSITISSTIPS